MGAKIYPEGSARVVCEPSALSLVRSERGSIFGNEANILSRTFSGRTILAARELATNIENSAFKYTVLGPVVGRLAVIVATIVAPVFAIIESLARLVCTDVDGAFAAFKTSWLSPVGIFYHTVNIFHTILNPMAFQLYDNTVYAYHEKFGTTCASEEGKFGKPGFVVTAFKGSARREWSRWYTGELAMEPRKEDVTARIVDRSRAETATSYSSMEA